MQSARAAFMLLMVAIGGYGTVKFLNATDGAAWIQCIWSVAAVFLAIIAPQWQAEVQANAEYRRQRKLLAEIVKSADAPISPFSDVGNNPPAAVQIGDVNSMARWESGRDALAVFPATVLRTANEVNDLMAVRAVMAECTEMVRKSKSGTLGWYATAVRACKLRMDADEAWARLESP